MFHLWFYSILIASDFENTGRITLLAEGCRGSLSEVSMWSASFIFCYSLLLLLQFDAKANHISENNKKSQAQRERARATSDICSWN